VRECDVIIGMVEGRLVEAGSHDENGQRVAAGQTLVELDSGDARAEQAEAQGAFDAFRAEALRRRAALETVRARRIDAPPAIPWPADAPRANAEREERVLENDLSQLANAVAGFDAQIRQKEVERDRAAETMAAQSRLIATLQQRVDMRSALVQSGSGARTNLIDAQESAQYHMTQLAMQKGQRDAAAANISVLEREREKTYAAFLFPVILHPAETAMVIDGRRVPLSPGMAVNVEIATGNRRILEYIFSPLVETASQALKER